MSRQPLGAAAHANTTYSSLRSNEDNCGGMEKISADGRGGATEANRVARRKLWWASVCCVVFMVCEIIGGFMANSLAIMTDAAHLLSDLAGFLISIFALWLAMRPATSRLSFGFHRAEILGALISVLLIWMLTGVLLYEAIQRVQNPVPVNGPIMFLVATGGLLVNFVMGMILRQGNIGHSHGMGGGGSGGGGGDAHSHSHAKQAESHEDHAHDDEAGPPHEEENLNVKAAFIHVLGDAVQSVGVMIAAGLIWYNPAWSIADPVSSDIRMRAPTNALYLLTLASCSRSLVCLCATGVHIRVQLVSALHDDSIDQAEHGRPDGRCARGHRPGRSGSLTETRGGRARYDRLHAMLDARPRRRAG